MPSIETQTEYAYIVVDDPTDTEVLSNLIQFTSKYTDAQMPNIFMFFKKYYGPQSNDKNIMTSYNSVTMSYMDMFIEQIIDAGD